MSSDAAPMLAELCAGLDHALVIVDSNRAAFAAALGRCLGVAPGRGQEHVTAIAWVFDLSRGLVLLASHRTQGWSCPGGHLENGEHPREAARRELVEETGLDALAVPGHAVALARSIGCPRTPLQPTVHWTMGYRFVVDARRPLRPESGQPLQWFPLDRLPSPRPHDLEVSLRVMGTRRDPRR